MARRAVALLGLAWASAAQADLPPPDWREELIVAAWTDVDRQITAACQWSGAPGASVPTACDTPRLDAAIRAAAAFERQVAPDARLRYLTGLAHRHAGRAAQAEAALREAAALDHDRAEVWSDLGELLSARGAWQEADAAFAEVCRLRPSGAGAWIGWLQRAQVAASQHDAVALEAHLREALDRGLPLAVVGGQPAWRAFYRDPALRSTIDRMVGMHADPAVLESLKQPPP
jgi:tetratricopeptide (TPR) repeat protein